MAAAALVEGLVSFPAVGARAGRTGPAALLLPVGVEGPTMLPGPGLGMTSLRCGCFPLPRGAVWPAALPLPARVEAGVDGAVCVALPAPLRPPSTPAGSRRWVPAAGFPEPALLADSTSETSSSSRLDLR